MMMRFFFTLLCVFTLHRTAQASMDPICILKAEMVCTNGKTISGYFSDYEFQENIMSVCSGDPTTTLSRPVLDSLLKAFKAVYTSQREAFFGFTLYAKAVTKDIFADSAYLGRYTFLLSDHKQDSISWMDIKTVLNITVEGAAMPKLESIEPIPFEMDCISSPVVPQNLFETIENQKVVNYYIHTCGEDATQAFMLLNYNPSISAQQLETWAKTLFQKPMGCDVEMFNVLFAQKVVTISTAAE